MFRYIMLLLSLMVASSATTQPLVSGEYFIGTDPGFGLGTPVSFVQGDTVMGSFVLDVTNLSPGFHSVYVRLKDENEQWGFLHRQLVYVDQEGVTPTPGAQQVVTGEYFVDTDPGFGLGTPVSFVQGDTVMGSFVLDVTNLTPGFHSVYVRLKDESEQWGFLHRQLVYVDQEGVTPTQEALQVVSGEYFVDTDPGFGLGTPVSFAQGDTVMGSFVLDVTNLTPGFHSVYVRLKDENEQWGFLHRQLIYVDQEGVTPTPEVQQVVLGEYFVDTDPGFGLGTPVSFVQGDTVMGSFVLDVTNLTPGFHSVYVRLKDENEQWGFLHRQLIYVDQEGVTPTPEAQQVVAAEFFVDTDPGFGMGTPISIQEPGDTVVITDLPITITQCLSPGVHRLYVRCKSANGQWGFLHSTTFTIAIPVASVEGLVHQPASECGITDSEVFEVTVRNDGSIALQPGAVQVVLEVTGPNSGMFGPYFGTTSIPVGSTGVIQATNVNLSQPGANTVKAALVTCENQPLGNGVTVQVIGDGGTLPTVDPVADRTICVGAQTTPIVFTGNTQDATYFWTNNQPSIGLPASGTGNLPAFLPQLSGSDPVTATITVIPSNGDCTGNPITFFISVQNGIYTQITGDLNFCTGTGTTLTAGVGASFLWSTGDTSVSIQVNAAGAYAVTVSDAAGCTGTASATVEEVSSIAATISGTTEFCPGANTTLTASGGTGYLWSTGATTAAILVGSPGNYTVTVSNASGCTGTSSAVVTAKDVPDVVISGALIFCSGERTTLTAEGASVFLWSTGATTPAIDVSIAGIYSVTATASNGCTGTASATVEDASSLQVTISRNTDPCEGGSTILTASNGVSYIWSTGATTAAVEVSAVGTYSVTVTGDSGCTGTASAAVLAGSPTLSATLNYHPTYGISNGSAMVSYSGGTAPVTYLWSNGSTSAVNANIPFGTYSVTVTDASGCTASAALEVQPVVRGRVIWPDDNTLGVNNVVIQQTGDEVAAEVTDAQGIYAFPPVTSGEQFLLTPDKPISAGPLLSGVTALDATVIRLHLTYVDTLQGPFRLIAGDVNGDDAITPLDPVLVYQCLLGNPSACNLWISAWRFVDASHVFSNPQVPWNFPSTIALSPMTLRSGAGLDFYGIKVGDVDQSVDPLVRPEAVVLRGPDRLLETGDQVSLPLVVDGFSDIMAYQFALGFDPSVLVLEGVDVPTGGLLTNNNMGLFLKQDGEFRSALSDIKGNTLGAGAPFFTMRFKVLQGGLWLGDLLKVQEDILPAEAYASDRMPRPMLLELERITGVGVVQPTSLQLMAQPNPTQLSTLIRFSLPEATEAHIRVLDVAGRLVQEYKGWYGSGSGEQRIELPNKGLYVVELHTWYGMGALKVVATGR